MTVQGINNTAAHAAHAAAVAASVVVCGEHTQYVRACAHSHKHPYSA